MLRQQLILFFQNYHEYAHLFFGLTCGVIIFITTKDKSTINWWLLIGISLIGGIFPDIDHLFFIFFYGRSTNYATNIRNLLFDGQLSAMIEYIRSHHKDNFGILSHNILSPVALLILGVRYVVSNPYLSVFLLSCSSHFLFDIFEDLLVFGRLNPNWYLKFSHEL